ncbi:MAG: hypothetical protein IT352_02045 [Gemmatimonadales bacterium]|nr:hypothetical protein [Gemmatimonadales bacterium]
MIGPALSLAAVTGLLVAGMAVGVAPTAAGHEIHVSYGRVAVEGVTITIRLRMFQDDLSRALARFARRDTVDLTARRESDSLATAYLGKSLLLTADGKALTGAVASSGPESDMWWYLIQFRAERPPARLGIANRVLFELFGDQQNLLKVLHTASGDETSLYFVPGEPGPVTLTFPR